MIPPGASQRCQRDKTHAVTGSPGGPGVTRARGACSQPGMDGWPRVLPGGQPLGPGSPTRMLGSSQHLPHAPEELSSPKAKPLTGTRPRLPRYPSRGCRRENKPLAQMPSFPAPFLPAKSSLPSKPQESSPIAVSEALPVVTVQRRAPSDTSGYLRNVSQTPTELERLSARLHHFL